MTRKKLKLLTFADYFINLVVSLLGLIIFAWLFTCSWGTFVYSIIFSVTLFAFMYSRGSLAAKIDLRENNAPLINALWLVLPLLVTLLLITLVYSLIVYNIISIGNIIVLSKVTEEGETIHFLFRDVASAVIRVLFFNITGFIESNPINPLFLLISPATITSGAFLGYYLRRKNIYLSNYFTKATKFIIDKFNN